MKCPENELGVNRVVTAGSPRYWNGMESMKGGFSRKERSRELVSGSGPHPGDTSRIPCTRVHRQRRQSYTYAVAKSWKLGVTCSVRSCPMLETFLHCQMVVRRPIDLWNDCRYAAVPWGSSFFRRRELNVKLAAASARG